jgi:predicted AAA+ superfamily ATPase
MPETMQENRDSRMVAGELHLAEGLEEKLSLAERFGICLAFHPFDQDQYLAIARYWLRQLGSGDADSEEARTAALQWALERGSRSGRSAWQFARDRAGRQGLETS